jgi:hypothetical protein
MFFGEMFEGGMLLGEFWGGTQDDERGFATGQRI